MVRRYAGPSVLARARCVSLCLALLMGCGPARSPSQASPAAYTKPISFAILEDYDKGTDLSQIARDFTAFRELGITTWRGGFGWDDYEPAPGRYDFEWLERFVSLADSMGISLRPYLGYTPEWAARGGKDDHVWNDPPRNLDDWTRFVGALASRLKSHPSIRSYEIYNEEDVPLWWEGTAEDYAAVLERAAGAIRRADPDATVLLGGMVWPDAEWVETSCNGDQARFDVLPFHAYPETWTPDSITVENYLGTGFRNGFIPVVDRLCGAKPIWINEAGFATTPGKTEREQAAWWVRAFATFLAEPRVEHIGVYEIRDQRQGTEIIGDLPNYYLGLIRTDGQPKLAFKTVKLLARLFDADSITVADSRLSVRVTGGKPLGLQQHLFVRPDGKRLIFVWAREGRATVDLKLDRPVSRASTFGLDGTETQWPDVAGSVIRGVRLESGEVRILLVE
jgi:hypothetical protein